MTDLRTLETESLRAFVQSAADDGYLSGRVLDFGCGKAPYRDVVEAAGGTWFGYDRAHFPANVGGMDHGPEDWQYGDGCDWDAILCTQTVQYLPIALNPGYSDWLPFIFYGWQEALTTARFERGTGYLVLTYPTAWPEAEPEDLHRFTKAGMERLLTEAGFTILRHERRAEFVSRGANLAFGYGVICRA